MSRYIDADALVDKYQREIGVDLYRYNVIQDLVDAPTVDAVPVVRCKDCVWNREKEWVDCYMSGMHGRNVNNFCSQGKRREE